MMDYSFSVKALLSQYPSSF